MEIKLGSVWRTRDGRKARVICVDKIGQFPIIALIEISDGVETFEQTYNFERNGVCYDANISLAEEWKDPEPPKQRKLYAYRTLHNVGIIYFVTSEQAILEINGSGVARFPEFDLTFPPEER